MACPAPHLCLCSAFRFECLLFVRPYVVLFRCLLSVRLFIVGCERSADIALIGLAVMGQNFIMNMNDHGFVVCAYNRTTEKVDKFLSNEAAGSNVVGAHSIEEM